MGNAKLFEQFNAGGYINFEAFQNILSAESLEELTPETIQVCCIFYIFLSKKITKTAKYVYYLFFLGSLYYYSNGPQKYKNQQRRF